MQKGWLPAQDISPAGVNLNTVGRVTLNTPSQWERQLRVDAETLEGVILLSE